MTIEEFIDHCLTMYPLISNTISTEQAGTVDLTDIPEPTVVHLHDLTKDHPDFWPMCLEAMYFCELPVTGQPTDGVIGAVDWVGEPWALSRVSIASWIPRQAEWVKRGTP